MARTKRAAGKAKSRKTQTGPKKPTSAYIIFSNKKRVLLFEEKPELRSNLPVVSRMLGEQWRNMTEDEKAPFKKEAVAAKERYCIEKEKWEKGEDYNEEDTEEGAKDAEEEPAEGAEEAEEGVNEGDEAASASGTNGKNDVAATADTISNGDSSEADEEMPNAEENAEENATAENSVIVEEKPAPEEESVDGSEEKTESQEEGVSGSVEAET